MSRERQCVKASASAAVSLQLRVRGELSGLEELPRRRSHSSCPNVSSPRFASGEKSFRLISCAALNDVARRLVHIVVVVPPEPSATAPKYDYA